MSRGPSCSSATFVHLGSESAAIERAAKRNAEDLLGDDSCSVGHNQQDQQLQHLADAQTAPMNVSFERE
jgi:hypothetical protein